MGTIVATPNQSFLCKHMEFRIAAALAVFLQDLGYNVASSWLAYKENPGSSIFYPSGWRKDSQHFDVRPSGQRKASTVEISFRNARWDGTKSNIKYGEVTLDHKVIESNAAKTKIIKNGTDGEVHVSYEESQELKNSFSSSVTKGVTLDMTKTKDASADVSTTAGAEVAGVKAEVSMAAHLGVSESKSESQSSELGREKAEEGTRSESIAIEFDAKPHSNYLVSVTYQNEQTRQPYDINGVMDFDIVISPQDRYWQDKANRRYRPHGNIKLTGIAGLIQFISGFDTNYPGMYGYWHYAPGQVKNAIDWIQNPENQRIQISGINQASLDSNASYEVKLLGSDIPLNWRTCQSRTLKRYPDNEWP